MPFILTLSSSDVVIATYDFTGQEGELSFKVCVCVYLLQHVRNSISCTVESLYNGHDLSLIVRCSSLRGFWFISGRHGTA